VFVDWKAFSSEWCIALLCQESLTVGQSIEAAKLESEHWILFFEPVIVDFSFVFETDACGRVFLEDLSEPITKLLNCLFVDLFG
jgi:hypothetical protein